MRNITWRHPAYLGGKLVFSACLAAILAGCGTTGTPTSFSIERLAMEDTSREGDFEGVHYRSTVAIHGLGTPKNVGSLVTVPKQKTGISVLGNQKSFPDFLSVPVRADGPSRILIQEFKVSDSFKMTDYLNSMDKLIVLYSELSVLEGKRLLLQTGMAYAEDLPSNQRIANADTLTPQLRSALGMQKFSAADIDTKRVELANQAEAKLKEIQEPEAQLGKLSEHENVWVWRWSAEQQDNASGTLGAVGSASASSQQAQNGYLIVAGMRITTLEVGNDIATLLDPKNYNGKFGNRYLVTQQFSAAELAFREEVDFEKAFAMEASLKLTDLGSQFRTDLQAQQAKIALSLRRALLAGVHGRTKRTRFTTADFAKDNTATCDDQSKTGQTSECYTPFYTVRVETEQLTSANSQKQ